MRRHPYELPADREIASWPGVAVLARAVMPSGHRRLIVEFRGRRRFIAYPGTPTGNPRAIKNHIQDIRRVLRELGAERV